ncbi:chemotaxis protein CheD [Treponema sp. J25]|uniref:chemotaxis protein CheD n=1 Tax=Treponema sp. J25 TaxID=2094121 RepID=UPI00104B7B2D|nr:chemotaxis protein CheD [Treponema sp. J25]TCW61592.1 archease [Treponema sp. J25]
MITYASQEKAICFNFQPERLTEYFLNPGELIFTKRPAILKTVLGSCVAVCLYDTVHRWGAMCHYLLPVAPSDMHRSTKYGDIAIKVLLNRFLIKHGSCRENLVATIVGGAFIVFDEREIFFIGDKNVEIAETLLRKEKIRIIARYTGGESGRRVFFNTLNNKIVVHNLYEIDMDDLYNPDF